MRCGAGPFGGRLLGPPRLGRDLVCGDDGRAPLHAGRARPREARINQGLGKGVPGLEVGRVDGASGFHAVEHDCEDHSLSRG